MGKWPVWQPKEVFCFLVNFPATFVKSQVDTQITVAKRKIFVVLALKSEPIQRVKQIGKAHKSWVKTSYLIYLCKKKYWHWASYSSPRTGYWSDFKSTSARALCLAQQVLGKNPLALWWCIDTIKFFTSNSSRRWNHKVPLFGQFLETKHNQQSFSCFSRWAFNQCLPPSSILNVKLGFGQFWARCHRIPRFPTTLFNPMWGPQGVLVDWCLFHMKYSLQSLTTQTRIISQRSGRFKGASLACSACSDCAQTSRHIRAASRMSTSSTWDLMVRGRCSKDILGFLESEVLTSDPWPFRTRLDISGFIPFTRIFTQWFPRIKANTTETGT